MTPEYDLTVFKLHFGKLTLKAYTKGEHVLRFEAIVHNTAELKAGKVLEKFPAIVAKLASMLERFLTICDCVHAAFPGDAFLTQLPQPSQLGASRIGGLDINKPRVHAAMRAALALAASPAGFTVAAFTVKTRAITGDHTFTTRQAAYDIRKLRAKNLIAKAPKSRRYLIPPNAARALAALLVLRDEVIRPVLAGVRNAEPGQQPATPSAIDQHYQTLRCEMRDLLHHLGVAA